jgi:glycerophosphoryl diester phosphodiesterase
LTPLPPGFLARPFAHRALHDRSAGRIENSQAAVAAAVAAGWGIEIDVQMSADGEAMVFHDETLDRLTAETGTVIERSAACLQRIVLSGGGGDTIPTLSEVLALVAGRVPILVEIKDQGALRPPEPGLPAGRSTERAAADDARLARATAAALLGYAGPVAVMSFSPDAMAAFGVAAPDRPCGLVTRAFTETDTPWVPQALRDRLRAMADLDRIGATFLSHHRADLANPLLRRMRARGLPMLCWTVRSADEEAAARRVVDQVTFEGYVPA